MRVEYTEPSPNEPDFPADHASNGPGSGRDQHSPQPETERSGADARTTVG